MQERILQFVNVALILFGGACAYYLLTAEYHEPPDIAEMQRMLAVPAGADQGNASPGASLASTGAPGLRTECRNRFLPPGI